MGAQDEVEEVAGEQFPYSSSSIGGRRDRTFSTGNNRQQEVAWLLPIINKARTFLRPSASHKRDLPRRSCWFNPPTILRALLYLDPYLEKNTQDSICGVNAARFHTDTIEIFGQKAMVAFGDEPKHGYNRE